MAKAKPSTEDDFVILEVGWFTRDPGRVHTRKALLDYFWALAQFLDQSGLLVRKLARSRKDISEKTELRRSHLTQEGMALMRSGLERWHRHIDRGGDPNDVRVLERALAKLRPPRSSSPTPRSARSRRPRSTARSVPRSGATRRRATAQPMSIDRADWHYDGDFPQDLEAENGGTHIGMYLAWVILKGLEGELLREEFPEELARVRARRMTGCEFLFKVCDEKFTDEDLNEEGRAFTAHYYQGPNGEGYGQYLADYEAALAAGLPSTYHVADTWENYDRLAPDVTTAYERWRAGRDKPPRGRRRTR